jgi:beta-phosphoglucomutase-like phosphatase (HAD superfamily)
MSLSIKTFLPEAVFFDFDGVLVESAEIKTNAFKELFKDFPEFIPSILDYHREHAGVSRYKKISWIYENIIGESLTESKLHNLANNFSHLVKQKVIEAPWVRGAIPLLHFLNEQRKCFVVSGTPEEELIEIISKRNAEGFFDDICGAPATKTENVKKLIDKFKLNAEKCVFIGDAQTDKDAADSCNMQFIARLTSENQLVWKNSDIIKVADLSDVLALWT